MPSIQRFATQLQTGCCRYQQNIAGNIVVLRRLSCIQTPLAVQLYAERYCHQQASAYPDSVSPPPCALACTCSLPSQTESQQPVLTPAAECNPDLATKTHDYLRSIHMCTYVYIHMCVYMFTHVYTCVYATFLICLFVVYHSTQGPAHWRSSLITSKIM